MLGLDQAGSLEFMNIKPIKLNPVWDDGLANRIEYVNRFW